MALTALQVLLARKAVLGHKASPALLARKASLVRKVSQERQAPWVLRALPAQTALMELPDPLVRSALQGRWVLLVLQVRTARMARPALLAHKV